MPTGENVVFVANDWHTALLPCYLKSEYKPAGQFLNAKVSETFVCLSIFRSYNVPIEMWYPNYLMLHSSFIVEGSLISMQKVEFTDDSTKIVL